MCSLKRQDIHISNCLKNGIIELTTIMSYTKLTKNKAVQLRRRGLSILVIAAQLKVAKSTISLWVRDIPLPLELRKKLQQNFID